jgi:hypothetical protein
MRTRPTKIPRTVTVVLMILVVAFTEACRHCPPSVDGSRLDINLTAADSSDEIEQRIRASLAEKYSATNIGAGYTMYHVTNGPMRWVFVKAYNAPRGLAIFNLYCYEQQSPDTWLLRAYVPVNVYYYTNSLDHGLHFQINDDDINVEFRDVTVFTTASRKKMSGGVPHTR